MDNLLDPKVRWTRRRRHVRGRFGDAGASL